MVAPTTSTPPTSPANGPNFDSVLRGYDRNQVDGFVASTKKELAQLKMELADAQRMRRMATEHAEATETELRELRTKTVHAEPAAIEDSFGYRAEKLLRMAEQEAAEARAHAGRESASIIEQARTEAEHHRHEVEQALIARGSLMEQQAAQRTAELQEREQQIADQLAAARDQADQLHANAVRAADRLKKESEAAADETKVRAAAAAKRERDQAAQEIARLNGLQADVRAELARLAELLASETSGNRRAGVHTRRDGEGEQQVPAQAGGNGRNGG